MAIRFDQIQLSDDGNHLYPYIMGTDGYLQIQTGTGEVRIGSGNTSYTHFYTDRPNYYFNKPVSFDGTLNAYGGDENLTNWNNVDASAFRSKANTAYLLDPDNTGTSLNVAGSGTFAGKVTATGDPGLLVTGSGTSTIHVASTGTGSAGVYMDASNGDFTGSDYVFIGQDNDLTYRLEAFSSAGDILLKESGQNSLRLSGGNATFGGGLTITGSVDSGGTDMGYYQSAGTNIILKGDSVGRSGIFFESEKDGTNINDPSDYGFIQFHAYGYGNTSGESAAMVIGVSNDSADKLILQAPYNGGVMIGYKDSTSGTGLTLSEVIHSNASSYNNGNWDTAYGWGNHASGGYAASSHTHSISNITGLQTSLDSKAYFDHIRSLGAQYTTGCLLYTSPSPRDS